MSAAPGYDNQPMFSADGSRILFAANRDGKQIDIYPGAALEVVEPEVRIG